MRRHHIQDRSSRDQSRVRGELPPAARDIAKRMSNRTPPIREATRDPIYNGCLVKKWSILQEVPDTRAFVPVL
jgi:hypothetical protein